MLPRTSASPAFTREVLRRVRASAREPRRPMVWRVAAAFAMAACIIGTVQVVMLQQQRRQERMVALQTERQKLEAELEAVKKIASEAEPVVVLENDHGTQVILDLDSAVQHASLKHYD